MQGSNVMIQSLNVSCTFQRHFHLQVSLCLPCDIVTRCSNVHHAHHKLSHGAQCYCSHMKYWPINYQHSPKFQIYINICLWCALLRNRSQLPGLPSQHLTAYTIRAPLYARASEQYLYTWFGSCATLAKLLLCYMLLTVMVSFFVYVHGYTCSVDSWYLGIWGRCCTHFC